MALSKEKEIIWCKKESCPLCRREFEVENVWLNRVKFTKVYTDSGKEYPDVNPLFYEIWVCPTCLYASYRGKDSFSDIKNLNLDKFAGFADLRMKIAGRTDFTRKREFEHAVKSLKLALVTLQSRKGVSAARYAMFFMRLAWLYRSVEMAEEEQRYMKLALARYVESYEKELAPEVGSMGETGLVYTIGELYRRTGDVKKAMEYFMKVVMDKRMAGDPSFIRKSRDQLDNCKEGLMVDVFPA
jgi:uncharacterized protein (DUF2225 family)